MRTTLSWIIGIAALVAFNGCGEESAQSVSGDAAAIPAVGPWNNGEAIPATAQGSGDAQRGWDLLVQGDYMTCGIPAKLWQIPQFQGFIADGLGFSKDAPRIPTRNEKNKNLPYFMNRFDAPDGTDVINANCLLCHGGSFDGQLIVGLGNPALDFTGGAGNGAGGIPLTDEILNAFGLNEAEKAQLRKVFQRGSVLGPKTTMRTVGMNPAEMFAVILMVHHDRETLAWTEEENPPLQIKDEEGNVIPYPLVTSDPPPWWRAHKKNGLFYNGMARGDHRGTMSVATSVCVDDVPRAQQVDEMFKDINAFIQSIRAPRYTRPIDTALADGGKDLFLKNCAGCHGTYAERDEDEWYPNLVIPLGVIGTDPVVANAGVLHAPELVDWYNNSFYGKVTPLFPNDPFPGYMPPPLDGIWATAPYLHNGSIPNIELVLNSRARPTYWKRVDLDSRNFDESAIGWPFVAVDYPQAEAPAAERKFIYDTTYWSQSNQGHTFGDHLSDGERRAVLEYLKTL